MSVRFNFVAAFGRKPQIPSAVCQPPLRFARGWHSARTQPVIFGLMILLAFAFAAQAQNASHLGYVYPAAEDRPPVHRGDGRAVSFRHHQFRRGYGWEFGAGENRRLQPPAEAHGTAGVEGGVEQVSGKTERRRAAHRDGLGQAGTNQALAHAVRTAARQPGHQRIHDVATHPGHQRCARDHEIRVRLWVDCPIQ